MTTPKYAKLRILHAQEVETNEWREAEVENAGVVEELKTAGYFFPFDTKDLIDPSLGPCVLVSTFPQEVRDEFSKRHGTEGVTRTPVIPSHGESTIVNADPPFDPSAPVTLTPDSTAMEDWFDKMGKHDPACTNLNYSPFDDPEFRRAAGLPLSGEIDLTQFNTPEIDYVTQGGKIIARAKQPTSWWKRLLGGGR